MCPASLSITCESDNAYLVSLFSLWWLSIQILAFFRVEGE